MRNLNTLKSQTEIISNLNVEHLQNILNILSKENSNNFAEMEWQFENVTIEFNSINSLKATHPEWCEKVQLDVVLLTKILLLECFDENTTTQQKVKFESICKTIYFMVEHNKTQISKSDLIEYFSYLLMHNLHKGVIAKRLTPISYQTFSRFISNRKWIQIKKLYQIHEIGFISSYSDASINTALKESIETLSGGDLTFRDWKEGGSFNNLTLDYGKYYVEHCSEFFDTHIYFAIALRKTLDQANKIVERAGLHPALKHLLSFYKPIICNFLSGNEIEELPPSYIMKATVRLLTLIKINTFKTFHENLRPLWVLKMLLSEESIAQFAFDIGISLKNANSIEIIKHVVEIKWTELNKEYEPSLNTIRTQEFDALKNNLNHDFDLELLLKSIDIKHKCIIKEYQTPELNKAFYDYFEIKKINNKFQVVMNFLNMVESAGIVKFLALTGWRESELGFTVKDINVATNLDLLDQASCPVRYTVNWYVPKTNAKTKVRRDITQSSYQCALKLALLADAKDEFPCLYKFKASAMDPFASSRFIKTRCTDMWLHFMENYLPFIQLNLLSELEKLKTIINPTELEVSRLSYLSNKCNIEEWEKFGRDSLLLAAYHRVKKEFTRVHFFLRKDLRKGFIWRYRTGLSNSFERKIIDDYLSVETKLLIKQFNSKVEISPGFTIDVVNEIMGDCLYPTPHAFRHMWAEAVYRRFDGDVGWLIRSNFKHITQNMWLAYIRNKDNRTQHQKIKRQVISSLLNNYVRKKGIGYAGATDKLMRRLFLNTKTLTIDELGASITEFGTLEIEDIKSNPWGFCMLRTRNHLSAKCTSQGIPQRQNASPFFCLGCTNNLIQNGNIEGILLGISNDIKIIQNPKVPKPFRKASYQTVNNAHKQLKKLDVDAESLQELVSALTVAREFFAQ